MCTAAIVSAHTHSYAHLLVVSSFHRIISVGCVVDCASIAANQCIKNIISFRVYQYIYMKRLELNVRPS